MDLGPSGLWGSGGRHAPRAGDSAEGVSMMRWKSGIAGVVVVVLAWGAIPSSEAEGAGAHSATGVGSCTIKNWNPNVDPDDAKNLRQGERPQSYKPDDFDCTGATFAAKGAEFARFPQPHNFPVNNQLQPVQTSNPLAPYFPPLTHV